MLTRSLLRTKIAQVLYANNQKNSTLDIFDNELKLSIQKSYDLYNLFLLLPQEIAFLAQKEIDTISSRLLKNSVDYTNLINLTKQSFPERISFNSELQKYSKENNISWQPYENELTNIYRRLKKTEFFGKFTKEQLNFDEEKTFWRKFFRSKEVFNEDFELFLEDISIYVMDDLSVTLSFIDKTISKINEEPDSIYNILPKFKNDDEENFVTKLAHTTVLNEDRYNKLIDDFAQGWNIDRITKMDNILLKMAIAEFEEFPLIPIKVTINEYIEISKYYSTSKSKVFINGILDRIAKKMQDEGSCKKIDS